MYKRGQITLFIIVGIIILVVVGSFFYIKAGLEKKEITGEETVLLIEPIKMYTENCLRETIKDVLISTGQQGGYFVLPQLSTQGLYDNTAYFFREKNNLFPSTEVVSKELSMAFDSVFIFCLDDFEPFRKQGYDFEYDDVSSGVLIRDKDILININFPLKITKGNQETEISRFSAASDAVRLSEILDAIKAFVENQIKDTSSVCVSCLNAITEKDMTVDMVSVFDDTVIFTIVDEKSIVFGEPYEFTFAGGYEFER